MTSQTKDHPFKPNGFGSDHCLDCGGSYDDHVPEDRKRHETQKVSQTNPQGPTNSGDEQEPREQITRLLWGGRTDVDGVMQLIEAQKQRWQIEAERKAYLAGKYFVISQLSTQPSPVPTWAEKKLRDDMNRLESQLDNSQEGER